MAREFDFVARTDDGAMAVDRRQTIVLWNPAAERILGWGADAVLGSQCYRILKAQTDDGCVLCRPGCAAIEAGRGLCPLPARDVRLKTRSGQEIWVNLSTVFVPSARHSLSVLIHFFREATVEHDLVRAVRAFADQIARTELSAPVRPAESGAQRARLTRREREVLAQLAKGASTATIAERLGISPRTARNHVANLLRKLGVHTRLEAVARGVRDGLS